MTIEVAYVLGGDKPEFKFESDSGDCYLGKLASTTENNVFVRN